MADSFGLIDLASGSVYQDARNVRTKFSKSLTTFFFEVGDDVRRILEDWVTYLRHEKLWGNDDPLFPATETVVGRNGQFDASGVKRQQWSSAAPIRAIFRQAFTHAALPYFNPHSLRKTLVQLGEKRCRTPEEFKAWSQNLGHEGVLTTLYSYGAVKGDRQGDLIRGLSGDGSRVNDDVAKIAEAVARELKKRP